MIRRRTIEPETENDASRLKIIISTKNKSPNKKSNNATTITISPSKKTRRRCSTSHTEACVKHMCGEYRRSHDYFSYSEGSIIPTSPDQATHIESVDISKAKCRAHPEYPLDTLCNDCHCLCCVKCKWEGEHRGHNAVDLSESQEALKASLEDSVAKFESYRSALREVPETATEWLTEDDGGLREVAELVRKNFSELREALDKKEEELLRGLEKKEGEYDATKQLVCDAQELAFEIPEITKGAGALLSGWDSRKVTAKVAGEVLAVRKRAEDGRKIVEDLGKVGASEVSVNPEMFLKGMKRKLEEINMMKEIPVKRVLRDAPTGLSVGGVSSVFISLLWDRSEQYDEFVISKREEGGEWSGENESEAGDRGKDGCIRVDKKKKWCFVYPLKPDTGYEFRIMGKKGGIETRWSEAVAVRTEERVVDEEVENAIHKVRANMRDADRCFNLFKVLVDISDRGKRENRLLGEAGAVEAVVDGIRMHGNNIRVCWMGCYALSSLGFNGNNAEIAGQAGAIDALVKTIRRYINDDDICLYGFGVLGNLTTYNYVNAIEAGKSGAIDVILSGVNAYVGDICICRSGYRALMNITNNAANQAIAIQSGVIDIVLAGMRIHGDDASLCLSGCGTLGNIMFDADSQAMALERGAVAEVSNAMKKHMNDMCVCEKGCWALWSMAEGNSAVQEEICEKGGLEVLLKTSVVYNYIQELAEFCFGIIGMILSTQKVHSKFCTPEILGAIRKWEDKWEESRRTQQNFLGLTREEDPMVRDAVARGVCTRELFPKCSKECTCDKRYYPTCWVQQKVFRCWTCDKRKIKFYCETCWKRDHQGHQCEEFFYPVRCGKEWNF